jgi:hypothetical protein
MTIKTNPAYAYLAYRKAIIQDVIAYLQNEHLGATGTEPKRKIVSDDVFHVDSDVPREEIEQFLGEMLQKESHLELEMAKFEFKMKEDDAEQKTEKGAGPSQTKSGEARGEGKRSSGTH